MYTYVLLKHKGRKKEIKTPTDYTYSYLLKLRKYVRYMFWVHEY